MNFFNIDIDKNVLDWVNNIVRHYIVEITNDVRENNFEAMSIQSCGYNDKFLGYEIMVDFYIPEAISPDGTYFITFILYKINEFNETYVHPIIPLSEERKQKIEKLGIDVS
jgi:hypothetical protein